jgi:serine/threonine protein kinase
LRYNDRSMLAQETILQGRYRIISQLGQGGMGAVYEAIDERLDTTVALKETLFADERLRKQFEREARLLARMHHPALPRVSDHFSEGEGQFLVMQFIAGDDLAEMMKGKQGPFPVDQVLTWGDQLLDALDYLHTQDPQIVHRDIKPQNLKLTSRGQIILLDFGLAKGQTGGLSVVTTSASIFGYTPNYAPLEQIQGLGTDARSDIYSLGATLYHLMTGVKPPDALTRAAALVNSQPDPLRPANEINGAIGPEVASVIARAMSQNREQRFATAAGMRAALKGTAEVATLTGRAEAATVLFPPKATATLADASQPEVKQTGLKTGETTVVQSVKARAKRRLAPWAPAAAALILIGIAFGGFYAYQQRSGPVVVTPATPTPSPENVSSPDEAEIRDAEISEPGTDGRTEETNMEAADKGKTTSKKNEKAKVRDRVKDRPANAGQFHFPNPEMFNRFPNQQASPEAPVVPETDNGQPNLSPPRRRPPTPMTRTLPDGSTVITNPDGTRILISPNGTQRILRPRQKVNRRRN